MKAITKREQKTRKRDVAVFFYFTAWKKSGLTKWKFFETLPKAQQINISNFVDMAICIDSNFRKHSME